MGKYLNPPPHLGDTPDNAKLRFCEENGRPMDKREFALFRVTDNGGIAVCIVNNGPFSAALICDTQSEVNYVRDNPDPRPKQYWLVNRKSLQPYI